jgi:hypothetical protein
LKVLLQGGIGLLGGREISGLQRRAQLVAERGEGVLLTGLRTGIRTG